MNSITRILGLLALVFVALVASGVRDSSPATAGVQVSGPISVSASLDKATCAGGSVTLSASVLDAFGAGVQGATVTGNVQYKTTGHDFSFRATDASGNTSTSINVGRPRGSYNVIFTVDASAGGYTAETTTTCYAP